MKFSELHEPKPDSRRNKSEARFGKNPLNLETPARSGSVFNL